VFTEDKDCQRNNWPYVFVQEFVNWRTSLSEVSLVAHSNLGLSLLSLQ